MKRTRIVMCVGVAVAAWGSGRAQPPQDQLGTDHSAAVQRGEDAGPRTAVRWATFNAAMNRRAAGQLLRELREGNSAQAHKIAEIVQRVRPDVLLINEIDYDDTPSNAAEVFYEKYLQVAHDGQLPVVYAYRFTASVNTGQPSGHDLDNDGQSHGPGDGYGYGAFPGQYGMAVFSRYRLCTDMVRTFQKFLWRDMPGASFPRDPTTGEPFYSAAEMADFRLSSKSHWDVPVDIDGNIVHFLVCHPTPPVFDGPEDRNGLRNRDEIRLWADYIDPDRGHYLYDDKGHRGGLANDARFVIAGDLNADPVDGDSVRGVMDQLLKHPRVWGDVRPKSAGGPQESAAEGGVNQQHRGDPAEDTGDFPDDRAGNLRIDYVLPSRNLKVIGSGVFWPARGEAGANLVDASDHRLVWVDVEL